MTGIFVTATGTDIGKTFISSQLINYAKNQTIAFLPSKPVISGWPQHSNEIENSDTARLIKASGLPVNQCNIEAVSPWRFTLPLAPEMAAKAEGRDINIEQLIDFCQRRQQLANRCKKMHLIEGVGGLMSPITGHFTNVEWLKALNCRCILVAGTYLGTLSHTLTALKVLENEGVKITALVINETQQSTVSLADTCAYLKGYVSCDVVVVPWQENEVVTPSLISLYHSLREEK